MLVRAAQPLSCEQSIRFMSRGVLCIYRQYVYVSLASCIYAAQSMRIICMCVGMNSRRPRLLTGVQHACKLQVVGPRTVISHLKLLVMSLTRSKSCSSNNSTSNNYSSSSDSSRIARGIRRGREQMCVLLSQRSLVVL